MHPRLSLLPLLIPLLLAGRLAAQDLEGLAQSARRDLEEALQALAQTRSRVEQERLPLAREISALEQQLLERRAEVQRAERVQENALVELNALKAQTRARQDEVQFVQSLLAEYERAFRTRIHIGEAARLEPVLDQAERAAVAADLSAADRVAGRLGLLRASLDRLRGALGGERFEARVLAPDGHLVQGHLALAGPVGLFAAADSPLVGLVQQELNKADPVVVPLPPALESGVQALARNGEGTLALDPTLGNAVKLAAIEESTVEHIAKGGVVMIPILAIAFVALAIGALKWWQLSRVRLASNADLQIVLGHLRRGDPDQAIAHGRTIPGPAGELLVTAVQHADEKKEYIEEVLYERMLEAKPRLEAFLPFIALTAAAAPLLGLLGTVTGMITTFNMISIFGTGDPRTLSGGISEALITTEYGLYVAIPAVLAHAFLHRKVKGVLGSMEQTAVGFINGIPNTQEVAL